MILVAGHYCHDTLLGNDGEHRALGGATAYASAILSALGEPYEVAAKVGEDFLYAAQVLRQPRVMPGRTTSFVDDYRSGERRERVEAVCEPILPSDLSGSFDVGLACGICGEIPEGTLDRIREISRITMADAQSLLREITPEGAVLLRPPRPFPQLDYLKASRTEAALLDVGELRRRMTLVITDGPRGCTIVTRDQELHVAAFPAFEKDPTGAGDSLLAGFAAGIARGYDILRSARLGAYCGARAVEQIGVPILPRLEPPA